MRKKLLFVILLLMTIMIGLTSCSGEDDVSVTGIRIDKTTLTLLKDHNYKLVATISPENATNSTISWSSSNSSVATVDETGNIKAIAAGATNITATSADGKYSASCSVTVNVNVSSIILSETSITLEKGNTHKISATVNPKDATDKSVIWSSSDTSIASVDDSGNVKAINGGNVTITAKSVDGKVSAICSVVVTVPVQNISMDQSEIALIKGQTALLKATISPSDATTKDMTWFTSDNNIVTVEKGNIKAVGVGVATITVISLDGNKTATCAVKVEKSQNIGYDPYGEGQQW